MNSQEVLVRLAVEDLIGYAALLILAILLLGAGSDWFVTWYRQRQHRKKDQ